MQRLGLSLLCRLHPRASQGPFTLLSQPQQVPRPCSQRCPHGPRGDMAWKHHGEMVPAPAALFAPLSCSLSGFLHPPSPLKLSEASAMGLGAARPGTKAAHQGKNWSPSELGNVPGKREVSFSWRSDTESLNGTGGGWLWEGKQGMVITGIPLQLQAALWVHPVRRGAGQRGDETQRGDPVPDMGSLWAAGWAGGTSTCCWGLCCCRARWGPPAPRDAGAPGQGSKEAADFTSKSGSFTA